MLDYLRGMFGGTPDPNDPNNPAAPRPGQQMLAADPMAGMGAAPAAGPAGGRYNIDPAMVASLMQRNTGAAGDIARQRKMADLMRQGASDQMQGRQVGNTYIAPNVANLAASVLGSWRAGQQDAAATKAGTDLDATSARQATDYFTRMQQAMAAGRGG